MPYEVVTHEELIEDFRLRYIGRVATWIITPAQNSSRPTEMILIDPVELAAAHARDAVVTD